MCRDLVSCSPGPSPRSRHRRRPRRRRATAGARTSRISSPTMMYALAYVGGRQRTASDEARREARQARSTSGGAGGTSWRAARRSAASGVPELVRPRSSRRCGGAWGSPRASPAPRRGAVAEALDGGHVGEALDDGLLHVGSRRGDRGAPVDRRHPSPTARAGTGSASCRGSWRPGLQQPAGHAVLRSVRASAARPRCAGGCTTPGSVVQTARCADCLHNAPRRVGRAPPGGAVTRPGPGSAMAVAEETTQAHEWTSFEASRRRSPPAVARPPPRRRPGPASPPHRARRALHARRRDRRRAREADRRQFFRISRAYSTTIAVASRRRPSSRATRRGCSSSTGRTTRSRGSLPCPTSGCATRARTTLASRGASASTPATS